MNLSNTREIVVKLEPGTEEGDGGEMESKDIYLPTVKNEYLDKAVKIAYTPGKHDD